MAINVILLFRRDAFRQVEPRHLRAVAGDLDQFGIRQLLNGNDAAHRAFATEHANEVARIDLFDREDSTLFEEMFEAVLRAPVRIASGRFAHNETTYEWVAALKVFV